MAALQETQQQVSQVTGRLSGNTGSSQTVSDGTQQPELKLTVARFTGTVGHFDSIKHKNTLLENAEDNTFLHSLTSILT